AILSASVYLTLLPFVRLGRLAMLDGMINTFFLIAIFSLLKGLKSTRWLIGVGIGLGLVALSKGVLAIALAAILIGFLGWDKKLKICLNSWLWLGLLLGFLPVLIWYGLQIQRYGMDFIKVHFLSQSIDRLNTAVEGNKGPITFYLMEILKYTAPWLFFLIAGFILQFKLLLSKNIGEPLDSISPPTAPTLKSLAHGKTSIKLSLIGSWGFLLLISLMGTKLPWYLMPFYIFFALITGDYLSYLKNYHKKYPRLIAYLLLLCSVIVSLGFIYFTAIAFQLNLSLITGFLAISLGYTTFLFFKSQWLSIPVLIVGLYGTLVILMSSSLWNWEINEAFAVKPVGALIKNQTPPQTLIYTSFAYSRPTLDFYSDRQILAVDDNELKKISQKSSYLLLEDEVFKILSLKDYLILGKSGNFTLIKTHPH
ncbi:MAG: ArnT family glycosyltransferase, partial [Microcystaceae cyanobacterium]